MVTNICHHCNGIKSYCLDVGYFWHHTILSGLRGTDALVTTTARVIAMVASVGLSGFAPSEISNSMTEENINRILKALEIKNSNKDENISKIWERE